jgi:hypothetical protein
VLCDVFYAVNVNLERDGKWSFLSILGHNSTFVCRKNGRYKVKKQSKAIPVTGREGT